MLDRGRTRGPRPDTAIPASTPLSCHSSTPKLISYTVDPIPCPNGCMHGHSEKSPQTHTTDQGFHRGLQFDTLGSGLF